MQPLVRLPPDQGGLLGDIALAIRELITAFKGGTHVTIDLAISIDQRLMLVLLCASLIAGIAYICRSK